MRLSLPAAALGFQTACYVCCLLAAAAAQMSELGDHRLPAMLGALPEFKALP